jgi:hypothetical protein
LKASFDEYGNPFLESSNDLLVPDTRDVADQAVVDTPYKTEELGLEQCFTFVKERLVESVKPLMIQYASSFQHTQETSKDQSTGNDGRDKE